MNCALLMTAWIVDTGYRRRPPARPGPPPRIRFRTYLERFTSGDTAGAAELLTDDFRFYGPSCNLRARRRFWRGSAQLGPIMRGVEIHRQWQEGDEVCSIYDFKIETPAGEGSIPMAEWNSVRDGKLASARLIFDTAAMSALMPAP